MRGKIKVLAATDVQLRVFARNNALELASIARVTDRYGVGNWNAGPIYCLPSWKNSFKGADEVKEQWKRRGGTLVEVSESVVLGRVKMEFAPKHNQNIKTYGR